MENDLYRLKTELHEQGIFFCFSGPVSQKLVTDIGAILDQKMSMENAGKFTVLRVFSLVVEKVQNIIHYSDEEFLKETSGTSEESFRFGLIAIGFHEEHYFVLSGNMIRNDKVPPLREKLRKVQGMSKEALKVAYHEQRRRKTPEKGSRGAGLGFLEMAKKAGKPIEFTFKRIDDQMSFFSIKTTI